MQRITNDLFDKIRAVTHPQQLTEAKMDPVGKEDADVNNDGKKDKSDKYLLNRRKAISTAIKNEEANFNPAPEPEERIENPTLNDKIREKAMQAAARISGMSGGPKVLSDLGPGAAVKEEVEELDEISLQTMKSAKEKLGSKALDAHYNDDKRSARNYAGRALHMDSKIKRKERSALPSVKEEVEELDEMEGMMHDARTIKSINKMKEVGTSKHKMAQAFHANIVAAMKNKDHAKIDRMHKAFKMVTEDVEEIDEASYSAKAARAGKDIGKKGKNFEKIAASAGKHYGSKEAGKRVAGAILAKLRKEEVELEESVTETIVRHNDFSIEITDNPTFADFFKAVQSLADDTVTESEVIAMASEAYDANAEDILIEDFTRMEIMDKHAAHRKAGNLVSHEKFSNKEGKPYAEYVVTDKEGGRKKYIHHGSTRRMESMASKK